MTTLMWTMYITKQHQIGRHQIHLLTTTERGWLCGVRKSLTILTEHPILRGRTQCHRRHERPIKPQQRAWKMTTWRTIPSFWGTTTITDPIARQCLWTLRLPSSVTEKIRRGRKQINKQHPSQLRRSHPRLTANSSTKQARVAEVAIAFMKVPCLVLHPNTAKQARRSGNLSLIMTMGRLLQCSTTI